MEAELGLFYASAESGGKSSIRPRAETHRAAEILHEGHPGGQGKMFRPQ